MLVQEGASGDLRLHPLEEAVVVEEEVEKEGASGDTRLRPLFGCR